MKILAAQLNYTIGDMAGNTRKILDVIGRHGDDADIILFSEACITGYYPLDLLDREGFIDVQDECLREIEHATLGKRATVAVGCFTRNPFIGKRLHNSLVFMENGQKIYQYSKHLLCDYGIYNELRHCAPGTTAGVTLLHGKRIGVLICEDAWNDKDAPVYPVNPVDLLARERCDIVLIANGSPSNVGKQQQRHQAVAQVAQRCGAPVAYVNQVGGYDEIIYDGGSFFMDRQGGIAFSLPSFQEAVALVDVATDGAMAAVTGNVTAGVQQLTRNDVLYNHAVLGARDYFRKCGMSKAVIGESGGIDSALTTVLMADAIGADNIIAVTMPSHFSADSDAGDAQELCDNLGIKLYCSPIRKAFETECEQFRETFGREPSTLTQENMQARIRGVRLMEVANDFPGAMVVSTGNKTELSTGNSTLYGDMNGGYNLLGDFWKTDVWAGAEYCVELHKERGRPVIPRQIIDKIPTAGLKPNQKDTDFLGVEYPVADAVLKLYIEHDLMSAEEKEECLRTLGCTSSAAINRLLSLVDRAEFKRKQAPPIVRSQYRSFGPGRQIPVAARYTDTEFTKKVLGRSLCAMTSVAERIHGEEAAAGC